MATAAVALSSGCSRGGSRCMPCMRSQRRPPPRTAAAVAAENCFEKKKSLWKFLVANLRRVEDGKWPRVLEKCPASFVRFHGKSSTEQKFSNVRFHGKLSTEQNFSFFFKTYFLKKLFFRKIIFLKNIFFKLARPM